MRAAGIVVLGGIVSCLIAMVVVVGATLLGLVAQPGPHEQFELLAIAVGEVTVAVGTALIFAVVLAVGGRQAAIRRTAVVLAVLFLAVLAAPEVLGLATTDAADVTDRDALGSLTIFLIVIGVPVLLTIFSQWWIMRRYLLHGRRVVGPVAR